MSRVAVIGPGRVGTLLAVAAARAGHRVVAVAGGQPAARDQVAALVAGVRAFELPAEAAENAELVVLAVPDDVLERVATELAVAGAVDEGQRVVHVAGAHGLEVLDRPRLAGAAVAACHPAMTVPVGASDPDLLVGCAWAVTAAPGDRDWARELVTDLGGDPHDLSDDVRALYHAGLTLGSNAAGAATTAARALLRAARVEDPGAFLGPLIERSVTNALREGASALSGPVVRGDATTVTAHLDTLNRDVPALAEIYRDLTRAVLAQVRAELPAERAAALDAALEASPRGVR